MFGLNRGLSTVEGITANSPSVFNAPVWIIDTTTMNGAVQVVPSQPGNPAVTIQAPVDWTDTIFIAVRGANESGMLIDADGLVTLYSAPGSDKLQVGDAMRIKADKSVIAYAGLAMWGVTPAANQRSMTNDDFVAITDTNIQTALSALNDIGAIRFTG